MKIVKFFFFLLAAFCISIPFMFGYLLYSKQEKLLFPIPEYKISDTQVLEYEYPESEDYVIASNGDRLHGWFLKDSALDFVDEENTEDTEPRPTVIVFGDNTDKAVDHIKDKLNGNLKGFNIASYDYRGYGKSAGEPSEQALLRDGLSIYDHIASKESVDKEQIIILGRSLGAGVACYVASQRNVKKLILVSPYDSMVKVAKKQYPWLPVSILLKHKFEVYKVAQKIDADTLVLIAENDELIEPERSLSLARYLRYKPQIKTIKKANHVNIVASKEYWPKINEFLNIQDK